MAVYLTSHYRDHDAIHSLFGDSCCARDQALFTLLSDFAVIADGTIFTRRSAVRLSSACTDAITRDDARGYYTLYSLLISERR